MRQHAYTTAIRSTLGGTNTAIRSPRSTPRWCNASAYVATRAAKSGRVIETFAAASVIAMSSVLTQ